MRSLFGGIKIDTSQFETPFTIRQVETHLVFGPLARRFPLTYLVLAGGIINLIAGFFSKRKPLGQYLGSILDRAVFLIVPVLLSRLTKRQQAIVGWIAVKLVMGFFAFMMVGVGAGVSFSHGYADAWPNLFLGLIWIPGVEFIPRVTPHQRYVTLARIALSLPCILFGVKSGNWHWG